MIKVNELFSGIGSQKAALERLGIEHKVVGIAEIDKYAIKSYEAIHGDTRNYGDISKINKLDYADFWTYSFPCQDISVAGRQKGMNEQTRSGLLYQVERLLEESKKHNELPKFLMLENVKNLVGKKFKDQFLEWLSTLEQLGYNTYWKVLNAKHYGIPQNRERVFAVSIRKDIDRGFEFPEPIHTGKSLVDVLEREVDEKYYLSDELHKRFIFTDDTFTKNIVGTTKANENSIGQRDTVYKADGIVGALLASDYKQPKRILEENCIKKAGMIVKDGWIDVASRVYHIEGISPTLTTMQGGNTTPKVLIRQATKKGYAECNIPGVADLSFPKSMTRRGRVQEDGNICPTLMAGTREIYVFDFPCIGASRGRKIDSSDSYRQKLELNYCGTSNTITTVQKDNYVIEKGGKQFRIRKLTPLECWRLMGFTDEQFYKAAAVNSNTQLYKQAGNSIVVDVLYYLFRQLFI
ncbi:cytosine-specific methyltransferase [Anaerocolumna cellulosilytica]|uniref:Cytosine-specific methyltransferase n=1 Tax=Anaerocolumna cellulosilytica TaxID=433286 RepID=A0A6S6R1Z8_9FIRM|nr:DNA (cytosine-5-)-methyltransferase [Anaerocolumna cellulosilytica]MBB5194620.1 DNA (cytosine-5)-methyltransferase 1 [Anaerocolumna cellulosilytica]BCJ93565.1 cytosine-specific methyltransferase [Anaerocolumna cellulosilytica]